MSDDGSSGDGGSDGEYRSAGEAASGGPVAGADSGSGTGAGSAIGGAPGSYDPYPVFTHAGLAQRNAFLAQQGTSLAAQMQAVQQHLEQQALQQMGLQQHLQQRLLQQMGLQQAAYPLYSSTHSGLPLSGGYTELPPPPPLEDAGISAGEIIGHRVWRVKGGLLMSMAVNKVWAPGEPMQGEVKGGDGVHAFKSKSETLSQYYPYYGEQPTALGTVALWGEVIEHEKGYRAEFGKVLSLDMVMGVGRWRETRTLRTLRERYGL